MNTIRKLARSPNRKHIQSYARRYYGTTGSKTGAENNESKKGNKKPDTKTVSANRCLIYDARKFSHNLPGSIPRVPFEPLPNMPTGIFRSTDCEVIGPLAGKCAYYRNPEYYSFHHMSFYDLHLYLLPSRKPQIKTGRKP